MRWGQHTLLRWHTTHTLLDKQTRNTRGVCCVTCGAMGATHTIAVAYNTHTIR
uniref:Uncharacterized protein n=1 Tax=Siphoviridae sp. ctio73 TaxID=2826435 RepID=A0A8S5MWX5_9CAUD|nr:MAG TPA: hypothetical protein [Siphoviridae sp. ctio73]